MTPLSIRQSWMCLNVPSSSGLERSTPLITAPTWGVSFSALIAGGAIVGLLWLLFNKRAARRSLNDLGSRGLLDGEIGRFGPLEETIDRGAGPAIQIGVVRAIGDQRPVSGRRRK